MLPVYARHYESIGTLVRFNHIECGDSRGRLYVTRTLNGWKYHCHNCAPKCSGYYVEKGVSTPSNTLLKVKSLLEKDTIVYGDVVLPEDYTKEIPDNGLAWLFKYDIAEKEIEDNDIGYSRLYNRLIFPIYNQEARLIGWQGRSLEQKPVIKYLNCSKQGVFIHKEIGAGDSFVIVEDLLSGIKIGRQTKTIVLFGSHIPIQHILKKINSNCFIWLDFDKRIESLKLSAKLTAISGYTVQSIVTELDPKCYDNSYIRRKVII